MGDEGVVAALMEEEQNTSGYTMRPASVVDAQTMAYLPGSSDRMVRVYHTMNVRTDLEDLFCKLAINFPNQDD